MTPDSPTMADALDPVIKWLEGGCDPLKAAQELRLIAADRASREAGMPEKPTPTWTPAHRTAGYAWSEDDMDAHGSACYAAGLSAGRAESQPAPETRMDVERLRRLAEDWADDCVKAGYVTTINCASYAPMMNAIGALAASPSAPVAAQTELQAFEKLAQQWDGCEWEDVADVGASLRHDFAMHLVAMSQSGGQP